MANLVRTYQAEAKFFPGERKPQLVGPDSHRERLNHNRSSLRCTPLRSSHNHFAVYSSAFLREDGFLSHFRQISFVFWNSHILLGKECFRIPRQRGIHKRTCSFTVWFILITGMVIEQHIVGETLRLVYISHLRYPIVWTFAESKKNKKNNWLIFNNRICSLYLLATRHRFHGYRRVT